MTSASSSAVFFLGTRAHYQILQQPETSSFDLENGNTSTDTIYQNPSVQELWSEDQVLGRNASFVDENSWRYINSKSEERDKTRMVSGVKRRTKRRQSETTLCERDIDMSPALLHNLGDSMNSKSKTTQYRVSFLAFLSSLSRRKRLYDSEQFQYIQELETALNTCTYRESCRCLDCQSRYFECDESEGYSSDGSDFSPKLVTPSPQQQEYANDDEDDEVFLDTIPGDNTSTEFLLETKQPVKMSTSSDELEVDDDDMQLEVAAGTPVLLNYLLTHPITCAIQ